MGLIQEIIYYPKKEDEVIIVEQISPEDARKPYQIVNLCIASFTDFRTPQELIELGNWLISEGNRIKKEYTSTGKKRKVKAK
ncbi:hypothetical protein [Flectobacillus sp. BAB-3569]|uniref:hypothetical protein n=1 Tax=Flectobacillus sp. BAB-3569 TaxID=1509483 RepID=UPI000BA4C47B|nr:hypothetical protein [Flectobacillus sp. BAB-3569]PAC27827.1 hypothetical protein BWI92_21690 [Flectobacillus sp. BAB-3569]